MVKIYTKLTFEEYLAYDDGTDNRYELFNGELVKVPPELELNLFLAKLLERQFEKFVPLRQVKLQGLELAVPPLPRMPLNRQPDLTVVRPEHIQQMGALGKAAITLDMLPPLLVAEVVSPYGNQNEDNYRRDYVEKVQQYQQRGIPEYWIIDPQEQLVTVLILKDGSYQKE
ncbi:Uma2 family endonuclease [Moorena sp. SIOASIH]|uniref:Uma2 family endonuclease n=1 Tax=Moorena sp. SIOASIH TaxID=2607817 RepID=UPI0025EA6D14|nr:Uma2 family endonuclease [Moorena sp. SIOASIH]